MVGFTPNSLIFEMSNLKMSLMERARTIQGLFDEFKQSISPIQMAKFLLLVNKKDLKELDPCNLWNGLKSIPKKAEPDVRCFPCRINRGGAFWMK